MNQNIFHNKNYKRNNKIIKCLIFKKIKKLKNFKNYYLITKSYIYFYIAIL